MNDSDNDMKSGDTIQDVMRERAERIRQERLNVLPKPDEAAWSREPVERNTNQRFEDFTQRYEDVWLERIDNPTAPIPFEACRAILPTISDIYHFMAAAGKDTYTDVQLRTVAGYTMRILSSGALCRVMDFCRNPDAPRRQREDDEEDVDALTQHLKKTKIDTKTPTRQREEDIDEAERQWNRVTRRKRSMFYH